jgi:nitroreductase
MEVLEAIRTRRSIRRYRTDPVDDKIVELVLEAARWAPSWANTQCWRFIVVRDSDIKNRLASTLIAISDRPNRAVDAIKTAPVVIVACAEMGKSGYFAREPIEPVADKGDWYMFDVALAMQNLTLAAHSLGLGTVHVGAFDAKQAAAILQVPPGFCVVEMTPLGYPDEKPPLRPRKELSEIVFHFGL